MSTSLFTEGKRFNIFRIFLCLIVIAACKKGEYGAGSDAVSPDLISRTKIWYNQAYTSIANGNRSVLDIDKSLSLYQNANPDWDKATAYERLGDSVIEVPLKDAKKFNIGVYSSLNTQGLNLDQKSQSSFLFLKRPDGYHAYVMTVLGDSSYVNNDPGKLSVNHYNKRADDFSGAVVYFTPEGKMVSGWFYRNGKVISRFLNQMQQQAAAKNSQQYKVFNWMQITTCSDWYYTVTSFDGITSDARYGGTTCVVSYRYTGTGGGGTGGTGGSGGTGGGGTDGDGGSPPSDSNPCDTKLMTIKANNAYRPAGNATPEPGGGGNGGGGGFPPPDDDTPVDLDPCGDYPQPVTQRDTVVTTNFALNDKAMCALQKLLLNSFYKSTLNNFIGEAKPVDLTFKLEPITESPGYINYGGAIPIPKTWSSTNIDLTINANRIDDMSSLQVAFTLLHEGIHAEIFRKLISIKGPSNLDIHNFPSLFKAYSDYKFETQHNFMSDVYINIMANALKQYDNNKFEITYYQAYAWQGLEGTEFYDNKSSGEKTAIQTAIATLLANRSKVGCGDQ